MVEGKLVDILRPIVLRYGIECVELALGRLRHAGEEHTHQTDVEKSAQNKKRLRRSHPRKRPKMTAPLYIAKLDISPAIRQPLTQLANKFEDKKFLPTMGEVRNFCIVHEIDEPFKSSRVAAIPRIFGFLATLSANDIQAMLQSEIYIGPSRLALIADAIRRNAKHSMEIDTVAHRTTKPPIKGSITKPSAPEKPLVPKKI